MSVYKSLFNLQLIFFHHLFTFSFKLRCKQGNSCIIANMYLTINQIRGNIHQWISLHRP